jgi:hypothetical protein
MHKLEVHQGLKRLHVVLPVRPQTTLTLTDIILEVVTIETA